MRKVSRIPYAFFAVVLGLCLGILMSWSMYRTAFLDMFPEWTTGKLSVVYSVHNISNAVMVGCTGFLLKKVQPQTIVRVAALLIGTGLAGISWLPINNPNVFFILLTICYGGIAAAAVGCLHPTLVSTFMKWFPENEGFINGLIMCPTMISSFVFGTIASKLIPAIGLLYTFRVFGFSLFVIIIAGSFWTKVPGADVELPKRPVFTENKHDKNYHVKEALKTPVFWTAFVFRFTVIASGLTYSDHAASIASHFGLPGLAGMIYSPVAAIGGFSIGLLIVRLKVIKSWQIVSGSLMLSAIMFLSAAYSGKRWMIMAGIFFIGFSFGSMNATAGAAIRILFGEKNNSSIYGLFSSGSTICSAIVGMICGHIVDLSGGEYTVVFFIMLIFSVLNVLSLFLLNVSVKKRLE